MQKEGLANHSYLLYYLFLNSIYILTCLGFLLSHWKIQQSERQIKLTERENCTTATIPSWRPHSYSVIPGQLRSAVLTTNNLFLVFYRIRTLLPEPSTSIPPPLPAGFGNALSYCVVFTSINTWLSAWLTWYAYIFHYMFVTDSDVWQSD